MSSPAPDDEALCGRVLLDAYRLDEVLGAGGVGTVYAATHQPSGRRVAVKVLHGRVSPDLQAHRRFEREATAVAALQHPNIIGVEALGAMDDGGLFLIMELAQGELLDERIANGPLHPRIALVLLRQALEAVGFAHSLGFVHRDLKPENIVLVRAGRPGAAFDRVKILDFGLVKFIGAAAEAYGDEKLTRTGLTFGTPAYMAPEQALGRSVDGRTDLYALGVCLFEMLTGRRPFEAPDNIGMLKQQVSVEPPALREVAGALPWCTPQLEELLGTALVKDPDRRFASAGAMIAGLDRAFLSLDDVLPA